MPAGTAKGQIITKLWAVIIISSVLRLDNIQRWGCKNANMHHFFIAKMRSQSDIIGLERPSISGHEILRFLIIMKSMALCMLGPWVVALK